MKNPLIRLNLLPIKKHASSRLKNPVNDAIDIASTLRKLGFSVTLKKDVGKRSMENSIKEFGRRLKTGGVGLLYYAGHGVQVEGTNYLIPVGARIDAENDVKYKAVSLSRVLDAIEGSKNSVNIIILDACRDNPYARSFRSSTRGLAIIPTTPSGTIISYATAAGQVARDGKGRNSPYTAALIRHMQEPGLTVEQVFKKVRITLDIHTGGKQEPAEYTNLKAEFYFTPSSGLSRMEGDSTQAAEAKEKPQQVATARIQPSEISRDDRFIAYDDGTVLDTKTRLMWAAKDNGVQIGRGDAKIYCENYRGGGYTNWRMPTKDELAGLYDSNKFRMPECKHYNYSIHVATELIEISCIQVWTSDAARFDFTDGEGVSLSGSGAPIHRALPVRSGK